MPGTIEEIRADRRLDAALEMLSSDSRPTALVAYSSDVAMAFLQAAGQLGLRIPHDLSLVMFGDGPSHHICRPVTTACYNMGEVGRHAVRLLLKKIEEPSRVLPAIAVQPWFFQGNTSGPPG
jgi:DNA-binding LacI/PurR family transcriptional regulator